MPADHQNLEKFLDGVGTVDCRPDENVALSEASVILRDGDDHVNQMVEWLKEHDFQWRLCYRATRDGWKSRNFHAKCDNEGPTVVLVKVDDYIFGGFTDQSWAGKGYKRSASSFLFSLKNKDNLPPFKAPVKTFEKAIYASDDDGPSFGNKKGCFPDFLIVSDANLSKGSYSNFPTVYQPPEGYEVRNDRSMSLLAGTSRFRPTEIEVFY